eukprot:13722025-Alexandrium_andersonii.AAC.1
MCVSLGGLGHWEVFAGGRAGVGVVARSRGRACDRTLFFAGWHELAHFQRWRERRPHARLRAWGVERHEASLET